MSYPFTKYHNHKTEYEGKKFDSIKEKNRFIELATLEKAGFIHNLETQKRFQIVPKTEKVKRARFYVADFVYTENGVKVIEDVKSPITKKNPVYTLKKALVLWQYPEYEFRES